MFVVTLTYKVPLTTVDQYLEAHLAYLDRGYAAGHFIVSGRKVPRTGGVILARADSRNDLLSLLEQDPFHQAGIADFDIVEFVPSKTAEGLEALHESAL
ncbi:hypothetical protein A11A3_02312 [Alcanivorax hongdengensis A-11-3]|uniref:YCII-related domain-containing protein n=1 Tax=Alcanivorax hongdengensis A-11-3 TaxID=1177179 RepID=L0WIJ3_9GAMM|nr:YciI family protein [Alcanivorax hongdengensis]EKF75665.1 hypothetical protein A11A3_02312 [Alcanivorax hongdengensis A-11-3]